SRAAKRFPGLGHQRQHLIPFLLEEMQGDSAQFEVIHALSIRLIRDPRDVVLGFRQSLDIHITRLGHPALSLSSLHHSRGYSSKSEARRRVTRRRARYILLEHV